MSSLYAERTMLQWEAESLIESLDASDIRDLGTPKWFIQHKRIFKLAGQACLDVKYNEDEVLKEPFISSGKVMVIIHELLITELWKEKVFPEIIQLNISPLSTVPLYTVLYHEVLLASLLGALIFHKDVIESVNDALVDLIDYCQRKVIFLLQRSKDARESATSSSLNRELLELLEKNDEMKFSLGVEAISFLSTLVHDIEVLPLSALHRFLVVHDIPMLLINLMQQSPWERKNEDGDTERFSEGGVWLKVERSNRYRMSKLEGQIWIALIQLILNQECQQMYEITNYRKNLLLKLKPKITEIVLDQMPVLKDMLNYLELLNIFEPPPAKPKVVIEQIPQMRDAMLKNHYNMWSSIAKDVCCYFAPSESQLQDICKGLSDTYEAECLEMMLPGKSKCVNCNRQGSKRCSQCKVEWYCGRKCQVEDWPRHKKVCKLFAMNQK